MNDKASAQPSDPIPDHLRRSFLFAGWRPEALQALARCCRVRSCARGEILFFEKSPCDHLHLLLSGRVQMYRHTEDGREVGLTLVAPGGLVGCAALFLGHAYPASARVVTRRAELLQIEGRRFQALLAEQPTLAGRMIAALAERLMAVTTHLERLSGESSLQRLAGWLLDQPSRPGPRGRRRIQLESSKKAIAESLGMTPETFSRCLRRLAGRRLVAIEARTIDILDPTQLEQILSD